jgi:hypothetical protein
LLLVQFFCLNDLKFASRDVYYDHILFRLHNFARFLNSHCETKNKKRIITNKKPFSRFDE